MNAADMEKIVSAAVKQALGKRTCVRKEHAVTLACAEAVIKKVFEEAAAMGLNAIAAVADEGANTVAAMRMDGAILASYDIAVNKAYTSVALKMPTEKLAELAAPGGELYGIQHTNGGKIVIFGGGEPLYLGGEVVGAIGVSGGTLKQDTELAKAGRKYWENVICH